MIDPATLKPCPFCGGKAKLTEGMATLNDGLALCGTCWAFVTVEKWQNRHGEDALREGINRLSRSREHTINMKLDPEQVGQITAAIRRKFEPWAIELEKLRTENADLRCRLAELEGVLEAHDLCRECGCLMEECADCCTVVCSGCPDHDCVPLVPTPEEIVDIDVELPSCKTCDSESHLHRVNGEWQCLPGFCSPGGHQAEEVLF